MEYYLSMKNVFFPISKDFSIFSILNIILFGDMFYRIIEH